MCQKRVQVLGEALTQSRELFAELGQKLAHGLLSPPTNERICSSQLAQSVKPMDTLFLGVTFPVILRQITRL